jgi:hypothetical protein
MSEMKTDIQGIHDECRELGGLIEGLEKAAVRARSATGDEANRAAVEEVERNVRACTAALQRVSRLAARRTAKRKGIPDPVTDLDQDPQD